MRLSLRGITLPFLFLLLLSPLLLLLVEGSGWGCCWDFCSSGWTPGFTLWKLFSLALKQMTFSYLKEPSVSMELQWPGLEPSLVHEPSVLYRPSPRGHNAFLHQFLRHHRGRICEGYHREVRIFKQILRWRTQRENRGLDNHPSISSRTRIGPVSGFHHHIGGTRAHRGFPEHMGFWISTTWVHIDYAFLP